VENQKLAPLALAAASLDLLVHGQEILTQG
jgi:hypothetical protein